MLCKPDPPVYISGNHRSLRRPNQFPPDLGYLEDTRPETMHQSSRILPRALNDEAR
jgi:hypothetical protein